LAQAQCTSAGSIAPGVATDSGRQRRQLVQAQSVIVRIFARILAHATAYCGWVGGARKCFTPPGTRRGMAPKLARRGVLMTATSRRAPHADSHPDVVDKVLSVKDSNREWDELAREVRQEQRRRFAEREFISGRRGGVNTYDDVASDAEEPPPPRLAAEEQSGDAGASVVTEVAASGTAPASADASAPSTGQAAVAEARGENEEHERPAGAVTAGKVRDGKKRRAQKSGAQRRKRKRELAKQKAEEEDEDEHRKWLRLKLEGEDKTRRIKASRIVYYYDHDSAGALFPVARSGTSSTSASSATAHAREPQSINGAAGVDTATTAVLLSSQAFAAALVSTNPVVDPVAPTLCGNFRSQVRLDLWDDDDDEP